MDVGSCMYAGSRNGEELIILSHVQGRDENLSGQVYQICGDDVGLITDGDLFVACNVCAFPVCKPCYDYDRKDGNQSCPQCKTIYKMHKGSPGVEGDEGEQGVEGLGNEYYYPPPGSRNEKQKIAEAMLRWQMSYGRGEDVGAPTSTRQEIPQSQIPRLTNGQPIYGELPVLSPEHFVGAPPSSGGGSKRVHPLPYTDATRPAQVRDSNSYGFGNVAWKERVESWKNKQEKNMLQVTNSDDYASEGKGGEMDQFKLVLKCDEIVS